MKLVSFPSRRLPSAVDRQLRRRLAQQHEREPFTPRDTRGTVRRVAAVGEDLGLPTRIYRGGVDLFGAEADHLWTSVGGVVVDLAFPLFDSTFVETLRRFVAGEVEAEELAAAAEMADFTHRVVGEFPPRLRYVGSPVWGQRHS